MLDRTIGSVWLPSSLVWMTVGVAGSEAGDCTAAASRASGERRSCGAAAALAGRASAAMHAGRARVRSHHRRALCHRCLRERLISAP